MGYVLEGSIRRSGDRVCVGAQLIDATTGTGQDATTAGSKTFLPFRTMWREASSQRAGPDEGIARRLDAASWYG